MTLNVGLLLWALAAVGVLLAVVFGPVVAGFAFAGGALGLILVLMGARAIRAIGDWRLEHAWKFGRKRASSTPAAHEERRVA